MRKAIQRFAAVLSALSVVLFIQIIHYDSALPEHYYSHTGEQLSLKQSSLSTSYQNSGASEVYSPAGQQKATINLMGIFPVKQVSVQSIEVPELVPSGKPFGVKMFTAGAIVVGFSDLDTEQGRKSPGRTAGLKEGDLILSVNGEEIKHNEEVASIIEASGGSTIPIEVERGSERKKVELTPVLSDGTYKSGIWVRDSAAGIGTITFVDPSSNAFSGLGHAITDIDTGKIMPVDSGEVCDVTINSIQKGTSGTPGELVGVFTTGQAIGSISANNQTGIYGTLFESCKNQKSYPMALKQEVRTGKASILCSLKEEEPREYSIEIVSVNYNEANKVKNMVIKVTDPKLIQQTGGIVQGMSGTPIIQDGKVAGAVTHVFVNDSTKGYAIFAENMYEYSKNIND